MSYTVTHTSTLKNRLICFLAITLILFDGCKGNEEEVDLPHILQISPNEAPVGKVITIEGSNFSLSAFDNEVRFNGIKATNILECSETSMKVKVPLGATTGLVTIKVKGKGEGKSNGDFIVTDCSSCGVIEKFVLSGQCTVEPINATKLEYAMMASKRGINFSFDQKSRLKSIGGLFRKTGTYTMEVLRWGTGLTPFYTTTITVDDTNNFVFTDIDSNIELLPYPAQYLVRYCGEDHGSVYDIYTSPPAPSDLLQPYDFGDVNLQSLYYYYLSDCSKPSDVSWWQNQKVFIRGVVDVKYEIIN